MTIRTLLNVSSLVLLGASITGCASASKRLGLKQSAPNEFNILTKAPLIVPPEYNLRPPRPGESSSHNNYSQAAARKALVGDVDAAEPSRGETVFMAKAGVHSANPEIRMQVDGQNSVERKTSGFSDRVLFWNDGKPLSAANSPLDPEAEAARLKAINAATGGGKVSITRRPSGSKLPGL